MSDKHVPQYRIRFRTKPFVHRDCDGGIDSYERPEWRWLGDPCNTYDHDTAAEVSLALDAIGVRTRIVPVMTPVAL